MIACDLAGHVILFNPAAERMLGYRASEVLGKLTAGDLFPESEMVRVGESRGLKIYKTLAEIPATT